MFKNPISVLIRRLKKRELQFWNCFSKKLGDANVLAYIKMTRCVKYIKLQDSIRKKSHGSDVLKNSVISDSHKGD